MRSVHENVAFITSKFE